jgi:predicted CXXCH cytochrome family protein
VTTRPLLLAMVGTLVGGAFCRAQVATPPANGGKDCAVCHLEWVPSFKHAKGIVLLETPASDVVADADTCLGCHDGSVADSRRSVWIEHGHRTGIKPAKGMTVPAELPLDQGKLSCRTCHTAHASGFNESLKDAVFLRVKNELDQMCKMCHADKTQGPAAGSHLLGQMKEVFPATLISAGAHAGPANNAVLCQSCHSAHGAKTDKLLLMPTDASQLCITCHPSMRPAMWDADATHNHPQNPPIHKPAQLQAIKDLGTQLGTDNRLVCMSCHKMHGGHDGKALLAETLHDSAMCIRCHEEKKPLAGSGHDLRKSAPAEVNGRGQTINDSGYCGACHTFHSLTRRVTTTAADPQGFCITCHSEGKVAATHLGKMFHPVDLPKDQLLGVSLPLANSGTDPRKSVMACLTCHDPHDTKHPHFLRVDNEQLCSSCHAPISESLAKPHDFTGKADLRNAVNQSPDQAGRCGFCHSVHQATGPFMMVATNSRITTMDDTCAQGHRTDGIAHKQPVAKFNHPSGVKVYVKEQNRAADLTVPLFTAEFHVAATGSVACASCHDVHSGKKRSPGLLRASTPTQLCVQCHAGQAKMAAGPHDSTTVKASFPSEAAKSKDLCMACHRAHGNEPAQQLWTVAPTPAVAASDGACVACHAKQAWSAEPKADRDGAMLHPQLISLTKNISTAKSGLPLRTQPPAADAAICCATCHDPHAPVKTTALLRIAPAQAATELCGKCHAQAVQIATSTHSPSETAKLITKPFACAPCHQVHASSGGQRSRLWATKRFAAGKNEAEQLCLGCHSTTGGASVPAVSSHPQTSLKDVKNATTQPTALVDHFGNINQITCYTCHLSHGRDMPPALALSAAPDPAQRAAFKAMLRPGIDREVCTACHGIDGLRWYLYFHRADKRQEFKQAEAAP